MPDSWKPAIVTAVARQAAFIAMEQEARLVLSAANDIVPLNKRDTIHRGTLQRSGHIEETNDGFIIRYSVKDEPVDYALLQHEHPEGTPPNGYWSHLPGRHWKYLETPFGQLIGGTTGSPGVTRRFRWAVQRSIRDALSRWP